MDRSQIVKAFLFGLISGLILLAATGGLMWYLSYSTAENYSGVLDSDIVRERVNIYNPDESPIIETNNRSDSICGLAYAQVDNDPWTLALYRQTAVGRLGEWFGEDLRQLDKHVRGVSIPYLARQEYRSLKAQDKSDIDIFTSCINEAMRSPKMSGRDEFVLLKLEPPVWEPWNTIAIYRLLSWVNSEVKIGGEVNIETPTLFSFIEDKKAVADWLRLSGQEHHFAFVVPKSDKTYIGARLVYGSASDSPLIPLVLNQKRNFRRVLCYKGTLVCPFVSKENGTSVSLPNSEIEIQHRKIKASSTQRWPKVEVDKLVFRDGQEELVNRRLLNGTLFLEDRPDPADFSMDTVFVFGADQLIPRDTLVVLNDTVATNIILSAGLTTNSDQAYWIDHLLGDDIKAGQATIMSNSGVFVDSTARARSWGPSQIKRRFEGGWLHAKRNEIDLLYPRLSAIVKSDSLISGDWFRDAQSPWAVNLRAQLLPFLRSAENSEDDLVSLSAKYVNNWDGEFTKDNIGASIFSRWMSEFKQTKGSWPHFPPATDTLNSPPSQTDLEMTLKRSYQSLQSELGDNPDQWMWSLAQPGSLFKTVWSSDQLSSNLPKSGTTKAFPIQNAHGGHFTTVRWQASGDDKVSSASWYFSATSDSRDEVVMFNDAHQARDLFGRLSSSFEPQVYRLIKDAPVADGRIQVLPRIENN